MNAWKSEERLPALFTDEYDCCNLVRLVRIELAYIFCVPTGYGVPEHDISVATEPAEWFSREFIFCLC